MLTDLLCDYKVARSAAESVRSLHRLAGYDLVITTSLEFVGHLRGTEAHGSTYVILIHTSWRSGAPVNDTLVKPLRQEELMAAIVRGLAIG